jgi:hypothetical protein
VRSIESLAFRSLEAGTGRHHNGRIILAFPLVFRGYELSITFIITNKETRTLKESLPLLLKRRLFTNFNMFVKFVINK